MKSYRYLILGGGMVAGYAAKEFIQRGVSGDQLGIVSADEVLPYERPPLSKDFLADIEKSEEDILIEKADFYSKNGIGTHLETDIVSVDWERRLLKTKKGEEFGYEQLLIATGAQVRSLDLPGSRLPEIYYLRSVSDSKKIRRARQSSSKAAVIGGGFIGMEVASVLSEAGLDTTLIYAGSRLMEKVFTDPISGFFEEVYRKRGVRLMPDTQITEFQGTNQVQKLRTDSGGEVEADLVVVGVGVVPSTTLLKNSPLELRDGVVVNEYLETGLEGVLAAGDVARYHDVLFKKKRRMEHWDNAVQQGKHAARVMTGLRKRACPP